MSSQSQVHQVATQGFAKGSLYDEHRPAYPTEATIRLLTELDVVGRPDSKIVDLGAGTGKFTEALAAREEGFEIIAVEPLDSMRDVLSAKGLKGVTTKKGTALEIGVEDHWADAVIVAQAFHWFATEEALKEIRRVLKPGGKLGLIWNIDEYNRPVKWSATTQWEKELGSYIASLATDINTRFRDDRWPAVFDTQATRDKPLFTTPIGTDRTTWEVKLTRDGLLDRMSTLSHIAMLEGQERKDFEAKVDEILQTGDAALDGDGQLVSHGATFFAWSTAL